MRVCSGLRCGDKTGTKRGQYQYVKKINSFTYIQPLFRLPSPLAFAGFCLACPNRWRWCPFLVFCSSEQRPAHGFDVFGWCWRCGCPHACTVPPDPLLFALVRYSVPPLTDANARPRKWPRKVIPLCPLIGGAADPLGVACLPLGCVRCPMASASGWVLARARPRPSIRRRFGVDLVWLLVATACPVA